MQTLYPRPDEHAAVRTDLKAIFVSLELSRSTWVITSLAPGGGEKMSTNWLIPASMPRDVWIAGGGITVSDGEASMACSSSRQWFMLGVQGQRRWWVKAPCSASEPCSKSS